MPPGETLVCDHLAALGSNMYSELSDSKNPVFKWIFSLVCLAAVSFVFLPGLCVSVEPPASLSEDNSKETLLLVMYSYGGDPPDCWGSFRISGCRVTADRSRYRQADAVFFRFLDQINHGDGSVPKEPRPPGQKWVWFQVQSSTATERLWDFEDTYNLTFSFREDSDIFMPLGYLIPNALLDVVPQGATALPLSVTSGPRRGFVSWVVSHWGDKLERVRIYDILKRFIKIDMFGHAGKVIPPGKDNVVHLIKGYRFYLAFENAQHTDYITEKLWNAVIGGAIPVVLGPSRKNYERYLPPEAFIHVDDFPTVQDLAKYLLKVKDSPPLIEMHLSWRRNYSMYRPIRWGEIYCTACNVVRMRKGMTDIVKNITEWWYA